MAVGSVNLIVNIIWKGSSLVGNGWTVLFFDYFVSDTAVLVAMKVFLLSNCE